MLRKGNPYNFPVSSLFLGGCYSKKCITLKYKISPLHSLLTDADVITYTAIMAFSVEEYPNFLEGS